MRRKSRRKRIGKISRGYRWFAVSTIAATTAFTQTLVLPAQCQETPISSTQDRSDALPALTVRRYDIPAGTLGSALRKFREVAEVTVVVPNPSMLEIASHAVSGNYTVPEVLKLLLAKTGLDYRFAGKNSIVLTFSTANTIVDVSADPATVSSSKFTEPLLDTPQSISVVPPQILAQQGVTNLRDALRNVAGISLAAGEGGAQGDNLTIRGFTARNDIFLDGMRDFGSYYRDPFNTDSVAVLEGPSSVMFGRGSTGGVVNQATKVPSDGTFVNGSLLFGLDRTRRFTTDINRDFSSFSHGTAFRLNLMGDEGGVAGRDIAEERRFGVAPSLMFGRNSKTRATLSYLHQSEDNTPDYGIPWLFNTAAPVDRRNYYGYANSNYLRTDVDAGTAKVERNVNDSLLLRNQFRYANYHRDVRITEARVVAGVTLATPLDSIAVNRNQISVLSDETLLLNQSDAIMRFKTGGLKHSIVAGVEAGRETSDPTRLAYPTGTAANPNTNLLHPNTNDQFTATPTVSSNVTTTSYTAAVYAYDTVDLTSKLELSGGVRFDYFDTDFQQFVAPVASLSRTDRMPNWRAAVVYKPSSKGSIYFTYGTSANPSAEALSLSAGTVNTEPEKNRTFEFGSKWELSRRINVRGAVFRTEKTNAREPDPLNSAVNVVTGKQRVDGIEVSFSGRLTNHWQMLASYALMDSRLVDSLAFPTAIGARLANVPRNTLNMWSTYEFPRHLQVGFGGNFVDARTASSTAPNDPVTGLVKQLPGYWILNAMAQYAISERVSFQVNVYNVADNYYYDAPHPGHIVPGAARTARASLNYNFAFSRNH
jgi:catecholate siderophore receptor